MSEKLNHSWMHKKQELSSSEMRKANKPLMEKKRRARINNSLGQLKVLVLDQTKKDTSRYSKLEKADILEMTVKHLRTIQRQQLNEAMSVDKSVIHKYRAGFTECAGEVNRYLRSIDGLDPKVRDSLLGHLSGCVQKINAVAIPPNQFHTNAASQQRLPSNPAVTFTTVTNHQAASIMSPLQVQIPLGLMNQHSLPTPPPSADIPPQVANQHHRQPGPQTPLPYQQVMPGKPSLSQADFMACHLLANHGINQVQTALAASHIDGGGRMNNCDPRVTMTQRQYYENHYQQQHRAQRVFYGNMASVATPRNSTSTPSPSQQSLSPPPRCESADSGMSVLSGESSSPVPMAQFNNSFRPIPSATRGLCPSTVVMEQHLAPSAYYRSNNYLSTQHNVVVKGSADAVTHSNEERQRCYGDDSPSCNSAEVAVDLSRPANIKQVGEEIGIKQEEMDLNPNVARQPLPPANAESVWRPW